MDIKNNLGNNFNIEKDFKDKYIVIYFDDKYNIIKNNKPTEYIKKRYEQNEIKYIVELKGNLRQQLEIIELIMKQLDNAEELIKTDLFNIIAYKNKNNILIKK